MKKLLTQRLGAFASVIAVIGVVASPALASAAVSQTANTTVTANVNESISISTLTNVAITLAPSATGSVSSASDTVTVNTNKPAGYNVQIADSDSNPNLVSGGNNFTPIGGTKAAPIALTSGKWGWAVPTATTGLGTNAFDASYAAETNVTGSITKWAAMPVSGSGVTFKSTSAAAVGDATTVWYGAKADMTQALGAYSDQVTYTATTN